ncbi:uncharacterized protein LOC129614470 [Condylostylus longicornis]|uniref:uncharacterized protein LOC129614470 n=1 Tax=Condylostylus longicornis TaxID=2530218 RepID=UPI00244DD105|nr:uncharacterized protein LOC129614470 [Condylostylus longicornis]
MKNKPIFPEIKNDFASYNKKRKIRVEILEQSRDTIEVNLINLSYNEERLQNFKNIAINLLCFLIYMNFFSRLPFIDLCLLCILLFLICRMLKIIKKDSICFYGGLALRTETTYFLNQKSSFFLPTEYIFDTVINEVIENLCVKYILIIRTKKEVYHQKPIIPVITALEPSIQCLKFIYERLRNKILLYNGISNENKI